MTVAESAERCLMPGLTAPAMPAEEALLLGLVLSKLKRVSFWHDPANRRFVSELVPDPRVWTAAQRARLMHLAWRYRFQLPPLLRPASDTPLENANDA